MRAAKKKTSTRRKRKLVAVDHLARRASKKKKRAKLSGWQFAKIRKEKMMAALKASDMKATIIERPRFDKFKSVEDYVSQIDDCYKRARIGDMPPMLARVYVDILEKGAKLRSNIEERRELQRLNDQLDEFKRNGFQIVPNQQFLPAHTE